MTKILCSLLLLMAIVGPLTAKQQTMAVFSEHEKTASDLSLIISRPLYERPTSEIILPNGRRIYNYAPLLEFNDATLIINSDLAIGSWRLLAGPQLIQSGRGSARLQVRPSITYQLQAQEVEGYRVTVNPAIFTPLPGTSLNLHVNYQATYGRIVLTSSLPAGESLKINLRSLSRYSRPLEVTLRAPGDNSITWESPRLPTGSYEVSYTLPSYFSPQPPERIDVRTEQTVLLQPQFSASRLIRVRSNLPQATFILTSLPHQQVWQGSGTLYTFTQLTPGPYELEAFSPDPSQWSPPPPKRLELTKARDLNVDIDYRPLGQLAVTTNVPEATLTISSTQGERTHVNATIQAGTRSFTLPAGRYRLSFAAVSGDARLIYGSNRPAMMEVTIQPNQMTTIEAPYAPLAASSKTQSPSLPPSSEASLTVTSALTPATFTLTALEPPGPPQQFQGQKVVIPLNAGSYRIDFEKLPNFRPPASQTITLQPDEHPTIAAGYTAITTTVSIPAGMSISGDPYEEGDLDERPAQRVFIDTFAIGTYEVTNAQYAAWLNTAVRAGQVIYYPTGTRQGYVYDKDDHLICRCMEAVPWSQIYTSQPTNSQQVQFYPFIGKDDHPVIEVSWYGAAAYCQAQGGRLPSEAEWEKAAGVAPSQTGEALKKYRYGTSTDTLDLSQANYKVETLPLRQMQVLTNPVGYYDGTHMLPLELTTRQQAKTQATTSPYGAYDMSGNVWEWVLDWYSPTYYEHMPAKNPRGPVEGNRKVAKGGCYDSTPVALRVAERLPLLPNYCDAFTGFRVAFDGALPPPQ